MKIAVIGHTGMTGKAVTDLLLARGHDVTGISRNAERTTSQSRLSILQGDVFNESTLVQFLRGHEAVISAFSGGHEVDAAVYYRQVEGTRKILSAASQADVNYLIYIGGAASLQVAPGIRMLDDPRFPSWYFGIQPAEHLHWLGDITGVDFFHEAAQRKENGVVPHGKTDTWLEDKVKDWKNIPLLEGCRTALDFFHEGLKFKWSFLSPPWLYRPGEATGKYKTDLENMIFRDGIPAGISVPDLAQAIADEVEKQNMVHKHWTVSTTD